MARSLTVPCTARWPADPPGKRSGLTTKESVLKARRSPDGQRKHGGVGLGGQGVVGEGRQEDGIEQGRRRLAAGAVGQGDHLVEQSGPAPAKGLDALEHRRLAATTTGGRWRATSVIGWVASRTRSLIE